MLDALANATTSNLLALVYSAKDGITRTQLGVVEWTFRVDQTASHTLVPRWIDARRGDDIAHTDWPIELPECSMPTHIDTMGTAILKLFRAFVQSGPMRSEVGDSAHSAPGTWAWIGWISYEFGAQIEPKAAKHSERHKNNAHTQWPVLEFHRVRIVDANASMVLSDAAIAQASTQNTLNLAHAHKAQSSAYARDVERIRELIRAGDIYQANLTTELIGSFTGNSRRLFAALARRSQPWYGVYTEGSRWAQHPTEDQRIHALLSCSPELYLNYDARTRMLTTRPMKGTRSGASTEAQRDLEHSAKDKAELAMIVDLMRNDLSRVCDVGTVRVTEPRTIEQHNSGVWQATATVQGTLGEKLDIFDAIGASFPGGSVTGAPKIRAMQIIEQLEQRERGPYCGCAGIIYDDGSAELNLSIRTLTLDQQLADASNTQAPHMFSNARAIYPIGSGIVIGSEPENEWEETVAKAAWLYDIE